MESENIAKRMAKIHTISGDIHGTTTVTLFNGAEIYIHPLTGIPSLCKEDVLEHPYDIKFITEKGNVLSVSLLLLLLLSEWKLIVGQTIGPNDDKELRYYIQNAQFSGKYNAVVSSAKGISSTVSVLII